MQPGRHCKFVNVAKEVKLEYIRLNKLEWVYSEYVVCMYGWMDGWMNGGCWVSEGEVF